MWRASMKEELDSFFCVGIFVCVDICTKKMGKKIWVYSHRSVELGDGVFSLYLKIK